MYRRIQLAVAGLMMIGLSSLVMLAGASPAPAYADSSTPASFWLASPSGGVWAFGHVGSLGSPGEGHVASPVVGIAATSDARGYWLVAGDGGVFNYGDAGFFGAAGGLRLAQPVVGMAPTPDGGGYWLVASDGGIFSYGDARFFGSTGGMHLAKPIVGIVATPDGGGYWMVASDGGVFNYGDAGFYGSTGGLRLSQPIISMTPTPDAKGYWMLAADGGVFNFGDATFYASLGASPSPEPAQRIVASHDAAGYWIVLQNGTSYGYGDATGAPPAQALMFNPVTSGDRAVLFAFSQLGKPYIWGGNGPVGYDCSGLTRTSWLLQAGINIPRVANDQYRAAGTPVDMRNLVAGDLVFWGSNQSDWASVYHAALYVGGGKIVESTGDQVQLNQLGQWGTSDIMPRGMRP